MKLFCTKLPIIVESTCWKGMHDRDGVGRWMDASHFIGIYDRKCGRETVTTTDDCQSSLDMSCRNIRSTCLHEIGSTESQSCQISVFISRNRLCITHKLSMSLLSLFVSGVLEILSCKILYRL